ncbi:hypothetical protein FACS1894211_05140 [Clostridia bacterium]|nr:hypothetical protein FACS1894211_05140 [Clostridia bacterium]
MDLIKILKSDLKEYTSIPFWSWNNELDEAELIKQIRAFKSQGIDGFIMHARTGLKTEYLSEKWFDCIAACLTEARQSDMQAWVYDENGWPSGFVEGRLLKPGNYAQYLTYDGNAVHPHDHLSFADILDKRVVEQFIVATHEEYYKRFKDSFGRELAGFFTDEPQYFRYNTAYSRVLPAEFKKAYGENIENGLKYLFVGGEESKLFRYKYFSLLNKLYTEVFYKRVYDWCERHNCKLTGHTIEEKRMHYQLWCCAGAMPSYEYEHIPGIDLLGRGIDYAIVPKQAGSVAQQLGKKQVLTETFACSGWDTTPRELRRMAEFQYVNGANMMCQHLASYSLKGQGKSDYPPSFSMHNAWINQSKPFNDYFKRLSYILCNTKECADILFIHPIRSAYMTYQRESDYESIKQIEDAFVELTQKLSVRGLQYHYGDEWILRKYGRVEGNEIIVGNCKYSHVIVPQMESMESSTVKLLKAFTATGGKLCFTDKPPIRENAVFQDTGLIGNCSLDEINSAFALEVKGGDISVCRRTGDIGEFLYIVNLSETEKSEAVYSGGYKIIDLENTELKDGLTPLTIPPMSSAMLKLEPNAKLVKAAAYKETDVTDRFAFVSADNNTLTLDFARYSKDGKSWSPPYYVQYINEVLIKENHNGELWLKYEFAVQDIPQRATVRFEQNKNVSTSLNGKKFKAIQSAWDVFFCEYDAAAGLKTGVNELVMRLEYYQMPYVRPTLYDPAVMESLKNCLAIDTEIESAYLIGAFAVNEKREITAAGVVKGTAELQKQGFPNFAGAVTFQGEVNIKNVGQYAAIKLDGRYMTAAVSVGGKYAGLVVLGNTLELTKYLKKGCNKIKIKITSSMRNMLGPHHYAPVFEPKNVGHYQFNFRGSWKDGQSEHFTPEYNLVKFGLDKITLLE